ncbi:MAG TPA: hypothetical protein VK053_22560 [Jiangellaceae bacterium]|nr:hypothetical protein [Jiangellaceae bacterium]
MTTIGFSRRGLRIRELWPLGAVTLAVVVLAALGHLPTWSGLVHLVALPPLDVFTDLRVLLPAAGSWPMFVLVLLVVLGVRVVVLAYLLGGPTRQTVGRAALFYALSFPLLLLAAALNAAAFTVLYARVFWVSVAVVALVVVTCAAAPWQGGTRLRTAFARSWRRGLRLEVLVPYAVVLVGLGVVAEVVPGTAIVLVPVSAVLTVVAIRALRGPPVHRPRAVVAGVLVGAAAVTIVLVWTRPDDDAPVAAPPQDGSLLLMAGINSSSGRGAMVEADPGALGYDCAQTHYFSYAGPGSGQPRGDALCPIRTGAPFGAEDTHRPLDEQVEAFARQTADLPPPVTVAAHSHAGWVAWQALADGVAEVDTLVLVSPFPDSVLPLPPIDPSAEDPTATPFGDVLRGLVAASDLLDFNADLEAPIANELFGSGNRVGQILSQELPHDVRSLSVTAVTDLPLMPDGRRLDVERNACPLRVAHTNMPSSAAFYAETAAFLNQEPGPSCPPWRGWGAIAFRPLGAAPAQP